MTSELLSLSQSLLQFDPKIDATSFSSSSNQQPAGSTTSGLAGGTPAVAPLSLGLPGANVILNGSRVFHTNLDSTYTFQKSPRLLFTGKVSGERIGNRGAQLSDAERVTSTAPTATNFVASGSATYALSTTTDVGMKISEQDSFSRIATGYSRLVTGTVGRTFGPNLHLGLHAGAAYFLVQGLQGKQNGFLPIYGAEGSFTRGPHVFVMSVDRTTLDPYGLAASSTLNTSGAWTLRRQGSRSSYTVAVGRQQLFSSRFDSTSVIQATGTFARYLSNQVSLDLTFGFVRLSGGAGVPVQTGNTRAIRLGFTWHPLSFRI
jgi:hypothetical protein